MFASSFKNSSYSPSNQSTTPKSKRKATRVQWACFNCRKRKQGCDSVRPCKRCVEKGIPCVEVESKRRRGRTKKEDLNKLTSSSKPSSVSKVHHHTLRGSNGASAMDISVSAESSQISHSDSSSSSEEDNDNSSCFEDDETEMCHNHSTPKAHKVMESAEDNSSSPQMEDFKVKCSNEIVNQAHNNNSPLMESVSLISSTSLINSEVYSAVNLGLLSPLLENFALSCNMFLSNFSEGHTTTTNSFSSFPLVDDMCPSSDPNYEFLGSLNQSDWQCLDAFSSVPLSSNPEQCSIDFCYKLLSKRLTNNEGAQKLHLRIKFLWKEILLALRNLDWKKAQLMLEEINSSPPLILLSDYVFRQAPSVVMWSPGGRIHFANEAFCVLSGYTIDELRASSNQLSTGGFSHSESNKVNANQLFDSSEIGKILSKQLEAIQGSRSSASSFLMKTKLLSKSKREIPINCSLNHLKDSFGFLILTTMIILP